MDVLTDVLRTVRVQGEVEGRRDLTAPWEVSFGGCSRAVFHAVLRGGCVLEAAGAGRVEAEEGDFLLLPGGQAHALRDAPGAPAACVVSGSFACEGGPDNPL